MHFRQAAFGTGNSHAVVGTQGHFQAAAQRRAVNRGDHRLGRAFHFVLHFRQRRAARRLAKLGDISAGNEGAAIAN